MQRDRLKRYWFQITALLFALLRGIKEGMVMIQDKDRMHTGSESGVRGQQWFRWYHAISVAVFGLFAAALYFFRKTGLDILLLCGIAVLMWECTEIGENIARYGVPVISHEHVNFADLISINLDGWTVYLAHVLRVFAGSVLVVISERRA